MKRGQCGLLDVKNSAKKKQLDEEASKSEGVKAEARTKRNSVDFKMPEKYLQPEQRLISDSYNLFTTPERQDIFFCTLV